MNTIPDHLPEIAPPVLATEREPVDVLESLAAYGILIQYQRADVDYESWYSDWMKRLASRHSLAELGQMLNGSRKELHSATNTRLRALEASHSMTGQSMRRAHARNVVSATGETAIALSGAIEIHFLFPEHAKPAVAGSDGGVGRNNTKAKVAVAPQHDPAQDMAHAGSAGGVSIHPVNDSDLQVLFALAWQALPFLRHPDVNAPGCAGTPAKIANGMESVLSKLAPEEVPPDLTGYFDAEGGA